MRPPSEVGENTDDETADGGDHGGIDTAREQGDVDIVAGLRHVEECLDHTDDRSEESDHGRASGDGCEEGETFLEAGHFDVGGVLDRGLDISQGTSDALDALLDQTGDGGVVFLAEGDGGLDLALVDVVADVVHEVLSDLVGLADHPPLLSEDVDGDDGKGEEDEHEPASL